MEQVLPGVRGLVRVGGKRWWEEGVGKGDYGTNTVYTW
jgi:hypothetical protein